MQRSLEETGEEPIGEDRNLMPRVRDRPLPTIDIALIGAAGFRRNLRNPNCEAFSVSLYEIDRMIEEKKEQGQPKKDNADIEALIKKHLPGLYREFKDVFSEAASNELPPHRSYDHKIELTEAHTLSYSPLWKQSQEELEATRQYLLKHLDTGFLSPSNAPFASPVLFTRKPDGSLRFCVDYRKLNAITKKDRYPLPLIDETLERLSKARIFTKIDIRQAFHRIRMHPDSEELTTFRTRYGSYKCKVLPFGLTNGPATFQRYVNDLFIDLLDLFVTCYLDDILIYSQNELEHEAHVRTVLGRLREAGLQADIKKCEFHVTRTK
jgi:hypothetical protein